MHCNLCWNYSCYSTAFYGTADVSSTSKWLQNLRQQVDVTLRSCGYVWVSNESVKSWLLLYCQHSVCVICEQQVSAVSH